MRGLNKKAKDEVGVNKRGRTKKESPGICGYIMHVDRDTQLIFSGMCLNASSRSNVITMNWCTEMS